jgi:hypothetical protein
MIEFIWFLGGLFVGILISLGERKKDKIKEVEEMARLLEKSAEAMERINALREKKIKKSKGGQFIFPTGGGFA